MLVRNSANRNIKSLGKRQRRDGTRREGKTRVPHLGSVDIIIAILGNYEGAGKIDEEKRPKRIAIKKMGVRVYA